MLKRVIGPHRLFILIFVILSAMAISGIQAVPFHPDESTNLFLSADFFEYLSNPLNLTSANLTVENQKIRYRLIDAPLKSYLAGLGLLVSGRKPLPVDWDWSASVEENESEGALPDGAELLAGRIVMTTLFSLSLVFIYLTGLNLGNQWVGLLAVVLLGTNSIVLLHVRRVMGESPLLLGTSLFIWALTSERTRPIALGFAAGIAINAKQSALVLLPLTVLPFLFDIHSGTRSYEQTLVGLIQVALMCLAITAFLNPVYWRNPLQAVGAAFEQREDLLARQLEGISRLAPDQILDSPIDRGVSLIANSFLLNPSYSDVGNYDEWLAGSIEAYNARPESIMMRGPIWGGIFLVIFLFGFTAGCLRSFKVVGVERRRLLLFIAASILQFAAVLLVIPLPWQRYTIPIFAFISIWSAYGLVILGNAIGRSVRRRANGSVSIPLTD